MDAKITKSRLGNMLSYDWLKIIATIVVAVLGLSLLFTMVRTRPSLAQRYTVYAYDDLQAGDDFTRLPDTLMDKKKLSYDVLDVSVESFYGNSMANAVFSTRRAAGEGTVMFLTDNRVYETDENGEPVLDENGDPKIKTESKLYSFAMGGAAAEPSPYEAIVHDTVYYMDTLCRQYLVGFYGENWSDESATPDGDKVAECFLARNGKDKRYRSAAKKEAGIADEYARIEKLQSDYLFVQEQFANGTLKHTQYTAEKADGTQITSNLGINVGGLNGLEKLVCYTTAEGKKDTSNVNLVVFYSDYGDGNDLRFETVSFLRYLVETYRD